MADDLFRDLLDDASAERGPIFNEEEAEAEAAAGKRASLLRYYDEEVFETEAPSEEEALAPGEFKPLCECSCPHAHFVSEANEGTISLSSSSLSSSRDDVKISSKDIFAEFGRRTHSTTTSTTTTAAAFSSSKIVQSKPRVRQCWYSLPNDVNSKGEVTLKREETLSERINRLQLEAAQLEEDLKREVLRNERHKSSHKITTSDVTSRDDIAARELRAQATCLDVIRDIDRRVARIEGFLGPANYESRNDTMSATKGLSECAKRLRGLNAMLEQAAATGEEDEVSRNISVTSDVVRGFEETNGVSAEYAKHVAALYGNLQRWEATVKALPEVFEKFRSVVKLNLSRIDVASFDADLTKIEDTQKKIETEIRENGELLARIAALVSQSQKEIDESLSALEKKIFGN